MKKWFILFGIIVVLFMGGYFVLSFCAVKLIQPRIQRPTGPGLTLAEMKVNLTHLSIKKIQLEDFQSRQRFFQIEEIRIYPSLLSLLRSPLRVREITVLEPSFFFYRSREGNFSGPWVSAGMGEKEKGVSDEKGGKKREPSPFRIDRIRIRKGSIDFEDRKTGEPPAQIALRELDLEIRDIQYPLIPTRSQIELKGKIMGGGKEGRLELEGWIDLDTLDTEASLKAQGIDVKILEPYYRKRVSAEILNGQIHAEVRIALKEKRIDAPGRLDLIDLRVGEGGAIFRIPAKDLIRLLKKKEYSIEVPFHVEGTLDDPGFNLQEVFLTRIALSLATSLGLPIRVVGEGDGTEKGAEGLVEGIKSIEEFFKKKKEKRR